MKKIYLVIAGAFLILLVIISILLSLGKKPVTTTQDNVPFPTDVPLPGSTRQTGQDQQYSGTEDLSQETNINNDFSTISPIETEDFKVQFNTNLNKIVIEKKSLEAEQKFYDWASENNYPQLINDPGEVIFIRPGQDPEFDPLIDFLNIFINMGQGSQQSSNPQSSNLQTDSTDLTDSTNSTGSLTYFPQCGEYGDISLPDGCNLCQAGCGPSTVSMIAASYLGNNITPKTIVDQYQSKGYLLGCAGSRYSDAKQVLQNFGLKTTDYLVFNAEKSDTVVPQLRKYLNAGWTFFTLASFCEKGCGHYFWITDIDDQGNIFAYDPAYGRYQIPYNENSRYPYPLYRLAFGVKR